MYLRITQIYISKNHPFAFYLPVLNPRAARADRAKCNRKICAPTYLPYGPPPALTPSARPYVLTYSSEKIPLTSEERGRRVGTQSERVVFTS